MYIHIIGMRQRRSHHNNNQRPASIKRLDRVPPSHFSKWRSCQPNQTGWFRSVQIKREIKRQKG